MLVLGRNIGETIVIDDNIYITIFETGTTGNKFKIAIDAPKEMKISRAELYENDPERWPKIQAMKEESERRSKKAMKADAARRANAEQANRIIREARLLQAGQAAQARRTEP